MTLTIGRCSSLRPEKRSPIDAGGRITIAGYIDAADANELKARRQQLLGLGNNDDEPVVPVTWSSDSTFDGFYAPGSPEVRLVGPVGGKRALFSIELEKLPGFAHPLFEVTTQSVVRTNAHGVTAPPSIIVVDRVNTTDVTYIPSTTLVSASAIPDLKTADSATLWLSRRTLAAPVTTTSYQFSAAPADFYVGACKLEIKYGSSWYPVNGRNIPAVRQGSWRITNGTVRLTLGSSIATASTFEVWDPAAQAWESTSILHFDNGSQAIGMGGSQFLTPVAVVRNSPESVVVAHQGGHGGIVEYFSIARGERHVVWHANRSGGQTLSTSWGVKFASATASTAITGGIRSTSNDANLNRWLFTSPVAQTTDLVNGSTKLNAAAATATYAIGAEEGGSGASSGNQAADIVNQFLGAVSARQRVVVS